MEFTQVLQTAQQVVVNFGLKVIGALLMFWLGRQLIAIALKLADKGLEAREFDPTLQRYLGSTLNVVLNIVLVIGILGFMGFETTSFAALLAAAGVAIGAAWSGLLSNFAAGAFLMVLRPFKVGDYIEGGGVQGSVREIGLFSTTILTDDNVPTFVNNSKLMTDTLRNYSDAPYRRVNRTAQVGPRVDPVEVIARLKKRLAEIPNVRTDPPPVVDILEVNDSGYQLAVRPYCDTRHYSSVFFATNRIIQEECPASDPDAEDSADV